MAGRRERIGLELAANVTPLERGLKQARKGVMALHKANQDMTKQGFFSMFSGRAGREFDRGMGRMHRHLDKMRAEHNRAARAAKASAKEHQKLVDLADKAHKEGRKLSPSEKAGLSASARKAANARTYQQQTARGVIGMEEQMEAAQEQHQQQRQKRKKIMRRKVALTTWGLAKKAFGWVKSQSDQGLTTAIENMMGSMQSARMMGGDLEKGWNKARRGAVRYGNSLAYTNAETYKLAQATAQATGYTSMKHVKSNMAMARGYSLDPSQLMSYQSAYRQSGGRMDGGTAAINKALVRSMKLGGFARPLLGELVQSLTSLTGTTQDSQERIGRGNLPGLMGYMGQRMGGAYRQSPARTARLLGGLHSTIAQTSGSDAAQAFRLRSVGFGSGKSYVQSLMQLEKGVTDPSNVRNLVNQARSEFGGGEQGWLALHRLSGGRIKLHQAKRLMGANLADMDSAGISSLMGQQKTNIAGEADKSRSGTGFVRRQISLQNQRAALRVKMDGLYQLQFKLQMMAMKKAVEGYDAAGKQARLLADDFKYLRRNLLGGLIGAHVGGKGGLSISGLQNMASSWGTASEDQKARAFRGLSVDERIAAFNYLRAHGIDVSKYEKIGRPGK